MSGSKLRIWGSGVRISSGAPFLPRIIGRVALSFTQCGMLFESMLTAATPATMAEFEKGRRVQRLLFRVDPLNLEQGPHIARCWLGFVESSGPLAWAAPFTGRAALCCGAAPSGKEVERPPHFRFSQFEIDGSSYRPKK